jgi:UDP-3-O-[3-hydroxymyristoyl] glucosamine N-acyltransferase
MRLDEIAKAVGGSVKGNGETEIKGMAQIENAGPGELTFLNNRKYRPYLATTKAAAVILADPDLLGEGQAGIISPTPYLAFAMALRLFDRPVATPLGAHPTALIAPGAELGPGVSIGPYTVIGEGVKIGAGVIIRSHCLIEEEAVIGAGSYLHSHSVVRERCRLGERVILQNRVVVGGDGFGYANRPDGSWQKIPQTGIVVIEEDVEIGAGTTIDRATIGETRIGKGSKLDNLVHIGHGSTVGRDTLLCAQVGLAGSTHVGNRVILGGQVGVAGHLTIGDGVLATAQAGIPASIEAGRAISGSPAIDHRAWLKFCAIFGQIADWPREMRRLRERLLALETENLHKEERDTNEAR